MSKLDDVLKHHGVKGMKWGVRRKRQNGNRNTRLRRFKDDIKSQARELKWSMINTKKMSTKDIQKLANRVQAENEFKRLSRSRAIPLSERNKYRNDYRRRGKMSDQELNRKLTRLKAMDALKRSSSRASKEQIAFGKEIVGVFMQGVKDSNK